MTSNKLKIIAFITMIIDHVFILYPFVPVPLAFKWIGRISAPIFIFCVVWSFTYTRNKKKYILRLYIASGIIGLLHVLREYHELYSGSNANIFRLLFSITVVLYLLDLFINKSKNAKKYIIWYFVYQGIISLIIMLADNFISYNFMKIRNICYFMLPAVTGSIINLEYGFIFVILGVIICLCKENKKDLITYYSFFCLFYLWVTTSNILFYFTKYPFIYGFIENILGFSARYSGESMFRVNYQWMMIFALPFMLLYNKKRGKDWKYFFYIAYPVHLILFHYLKSLFYN